MIIRILYRYKIFYILNQNQYIYIFNYTNNKSLLIQYGG